MFSRSIGILRNIDESGAGESNPPPSSGSNSAPSSDASSGETPFEFDSVEDAFDKVADHFSNNWEDPRPDHNEPENPFADDDEDEDGQNDDEEMDSDPDSPETNREGTPDEGDKDDKDGEDFKPYTFKGKVAGEDIERTYNSKEEMDRALARAEFAPRLYNQVRKMEAEASELKPDAEFGRDMLEVAQSDPADFLDIVEKDLIPTASLSSWVYDKYHEFAKLAKMSPQEQQAHAMQKEAEKIIENDRYRRQQDEERRRQEDSKRIENETRQFSNWLSKEQRKWEKSVPPEYRQNVATAIKTVVGYARRELDSNKNVSFKDMSGMIHQILNPYKSSKSPADTEREVANAVEAKKNKATSAIQRAARGAAGQRPSGNKEKGKMAYTAEDVFNGFEAAVRTGRSRIRE